MTRELLWQLLPAFFAGGVIGLLYFGGLWWTVRRLRRIEHPYRLMIVSFLLRSVLALAGFFLIAAGGWENLLAAIAGFVITRLVLTHLPFTRNRKEPIRTEIERTA